MAENASNQSNGRFGSRNGSNTSIQTNANANADMDASVHMNPHSVTGTNVNGNRNMSVATLVKELTEVGPELGATTTLAIATAISEKEKDKEKDSMEKQMLREKNDAKVIDHTLPVHDEAFQGTVNVNWTANEEKALIRRLDLRIVPLVTLLYLCNFIDRTNIGNAKVAGLETDLGLVGYQYNIGLSIFYIAYTIVEVPTLVLAFGFVCFSTAFVTNFGGFMTLRTTLGLAEGGMMPGVAYYLSTWYKGDELALRIGLFVSAASISGAFGGLLASAFLSIPQIPHLPYGRWRNVFLIEGVLTITCAFIGYLYLPRSPERSKFLTEKERSIAIQRLARENHGAADEGPIEWALVRRAWFSMTNWMCALCFLFTNISVQGMALFMPSLISGMGYSTIQTQLLTVPPYFVASIVSILVAWLSQRYSKRGIWILMMLPLAMIGSGMLIGSNNRNVEYAGIFFLASGIFPNGPLFLTWANNNSAPYTTRAVSSAMVVSIGSLGPLVSSWVYLPRDSPQYITGLSVQLVGQVIAFFIVIFLMMWLHRENRLRQCGRRDWRLDADAAIVAKLGHLHPRFKLAV